MITKEDKKKQIAVLSDYMGRAKASFLVNFQGMKVEQMTHIRKELKQNFAEMKVFRNTLLRQALKEHLEVKEHFSSSLKGSNAFVFAFEDPCNVAKIITNYVKETEVLQIRTGMMDGVGISEIDIKKLATLPPLDILKAQFLSVLSAPLRKGLSLFSAVPAGLVRVINTYKETIDSKK